MKRLPRNIIILLGILFSNWCYSNQYFFEHISSKQGLSQNEIIAIFQDSKGLMWFSTYDGLNRYDGYEFKVFRPGDKKDGLSSIVTSIISEDENEVLWIVSNYNTIDRFDLNTETFIKDDNLSDVLSFTETVSDIVHRNQCTYILTLKELVVLNFQGKELKINRFNRENVSNVYFDFLGKMRFVNDTLAYILDRNFNIIQLDISGDTYAFSYFKDSATLGANMILPYKDGIITAGFRGLAFIDKNKKTIPISDQSGRVVTLDDNGSLWFGTYSGLYKFKPSDGEIPFVPKKHFKEGGKNTTISGKNVSSLFNDNNGILWIGLDGGGVNKHNPNRKKFHFYNSSDVEGSVVSNKLGTIYEDSLHNVWFGTKHSGLSVLYQKNEKQFGTGFYNFESDLFKQGYIRDIKELTFKGKKQLFIASSDVDFNKHFNPDLKNTSLAQQNFYSSALQYTFCMEEDEDALWFGSYGGGLLKYSSRNDRLVGYNNSDNPISLSSNIVRNILLDSKNRLWIGTDNGLNILSPLERKKEIPVFKKYFNNHGDTSSISNNYVLILFETSDNQIVVGTLGGGLNFFEEGTKSFKRLTTKDGLPNNVIKGILEDDEKNLWVSTNNGLSKITLQDLSVRNYDVLDGLQNNEFGEYSCCRLHDGQMIFGGVSGFNVFYPDQILIDSIPPRVLLTDFQISNQSISVDDKIGNRVILQKSLNNTQKLKLHYAENSFSFLFTGLYFANPSNVKYKYKLEGFDKEWQYTHSSLRMAKYTNIRPGKYVFKLNAANPDGFWNKQDKEIEIVIVPPFYLSKLAFVFYILLAIGLFLLFRAYNTKRIKMENALEMERFEKEKIMELSQTKLQFFTNISHEFRTPLSLVRLCFEGVQNMFKDRKEHQLDDFVSTGQRNIEVLLRLISQLIDFRKLEQGKLVFSPRETDMVQLLKRDYDSFKILAKKKNISFSFESAMNNLSIPIDENKIEMVFNNLLSNAFKFTQEGDSISVKLSQSEDNVKIVVSDSGVGISEKNQKYIFDRFYQAEKIEKTNVDSSGIGLSLAKAFVEMHDGTISLDSEPNRETTFTVKIPVKKKDEASDNSPMQEALKDVVHGSLVPDKRATFDELLNEEEEKKTVLIVEDNAELRNLLVAGLEGSYKIVQAENGKDGHDLSLKLFPDLIISDVMMPVMDGLELCKEIKTDIQTSHIPIILLTAKTKDEHKMEGYEHGADVYVEKPFNFDVLKMQIKALFDFSRRLHDKFNQVPDAKPKLPGILPVDQRFIEKVQDSIKRNMSNPDYGLENLVDDCNVSTSTLIRKFRHLFGVTPKVFIKYRRLKYAEKLLRENRLSISEIIVETGFVDASHFAKSFKKEFGVTPRNFIK